MIVVLNNIFDDKAELTMLYTIIVVLAVLWALGLIIHIGGELIHLLLLVALIMLVYNLMRRRRGRKL
jgi:hypothetical protein